MKKVSFAKLISIVLVLMVAIALLQTIQLSVLHHEVEEHAAQVSQIVREREAVRVSAGMRQG